MMTDFLLYIGTILIWGSTWFAIKFQLGIVAPEVSVAYRFAIASVFLFLWCFLKKSNLRFTLTDHIFMILQGLFLFSINYQFAYLATRYLTSGLNAVIFSTVMIFNIINSAIFFKSGVSIRVAVGATFGLLGICIVFNSDFSNLNLSSGPLVGMAFSMGGAALASYGNIISARHQRRSLPVTETNAFAMGYGALLTFVVLIFKKSPITFDSSSTYIGSLLYLSVFGSILAFGFYLKLLGRIGPQRASYALILTPIVALAISTYFEGFIWTPNVFLGIGFILCGNVLVLTKKKARLLTTIQESRKQTI
jgi:drug/metabolite transporter (DMT)-like permease